MTRPPTDQQPTRRRAAPESAKDILGHLDSIRERLHRAQGVAGAAGFTQTAQALVAATTAIDEQLALVEAALPRDIQALRQQ